MPKALRAFQRPAMPPLASFEISIIRKCNEVTTKGDYRDTSRKSTFE